MRRITVDVRRAHLHPHRRRDTDGADGEAQHARCFHAGTENFILVVGRLDAIDAASHQVDQAACAVEFSTPLAQSAGIPAYMPPWPAWFRWVARQEHDRHA